MHEKTIGLPEQARIALLADPLKYNFTATERAALRAYQEILRTTDDIIVAKELFNSAWIKDPARADVKNIDEVLAKLTPENVSNKTNYYKLKADQSPIPGKLWYNFRSFFVGLRDHFRKEPRKPNVTKETPISWIDRLAEKKIFGMSASRVLSYLAFGLTLCGVVAACLVTAGMIAPFGAISVLGATATFVGTGVGIVSGEASDRHDANKYMKDTHKMLSDAYKIRQAAKTSGNTSILQKSQDNITRLLDHTMRHLQMEQIDGYRPTTAEKAMFGLKISCALLGATGPIASGLNLFGSTMINGSLSTSAQLTSNISSGIAAVNNGTNLVYKHARHESEIESTKLLKRTTSTETVSNAMDLTSGLQFHKKTLRWSDLHPPRNKAIFSSKPSETAARTI